jgi:hypothetical protein
VAAAIAFPKHRADFHNLAALIYIDLLSRER